MGTKSCNLHFAGLPYVPPTLILIGGPIQKAFGLGVKWSSFENGGPPAGITRYKPIKQYQGSQALQDNDNALQKQLIKMCQKCYQPALLDVLRRQEKISELLVPSCPHPHAAGLGKQGQC